MKKRVYSLTSLFLGAVLTLGCLSGCKSSKDKTNGEQITVWATSATEKIFRTQEVEDTSQKSMNITMSKNEYEGAQLMMRADFDVGAYNVTVSDLVLQNYVIEKENISIYNVKYISSAGIATKYNNDALPVGSSMPDALLPFDTAVEYGENVLPKDVNQSVYIEVYTNADTAAGQYKGTIKLTAGDYDYYMTLNVTVKDFVVPDEPSTKSYFARWGSEHISSAEGDSTDEFNEVLFQQQLKYRMGSTLPFEGEGGAKRYVELLRKYYHASGFSCYKLFYEATYSYYNDMLIAYNVPLMKEYLKAVIVASIEDKTNYLDKAIFYFSTFVDEPDSNPNVTWDMVAQISQTVACMLEDVATECDTELAGMENFDYYTDTVRQTVLDIPNIIPGSYPVSSLEDCGAEDITACTVLNLFNTASARESYQRDDMETWWYTCIGPQYPYPNLLANSWLTGTRLISWMQRAYDIDGFLIWDTFNYTDGDNNATPIINGYDSLKDTMTGVSDGKIFYAGAPYGITGAIASLRAVAYRDGMEDYELLNAIYDKYESQGLDAGVALTDLYSDLFSGVITTSESELLATAREELYSIYEDLTGEYALYWKEITEKADNAEISFVLSGTGYAVKANGKTLTAGTDGVYTLKLTSSDNGRVEVLISKNGIQKKYVKYLSATYHALTDFENGDTSLVGVNGSSAKEISTDKSSSGTQSVKITLNGKENDVTYTPWFSIKASGFDVSTSSALVYEVYSDKAMSFNLVARYEKNGANYEEAVGTIEIEAGWNYIETELPSAIQSLANISEFRFKTTNPVNDDGTASSITLYVDNLGYRGEKTSSEKAGGTDKGSLVIALAGTAATTGSKSTLIVEDAPANVYEGDYLLLADFENYNAIAQMKYLHNFGKVELVSDAPYVTHGEKAAKLTIVGRGETLKKFDPTIEIFTMHEYFQKQDFSDVDYLGVDMYNAMDYELTVRFTYAATYYSKYTKVLSFTLAPGANHLTIDLTELKATKGSSSFTNFYFVFDRGELFDEDRIVYIDNFRAHIVG